MADGAAGDLDDVSSSPDVESLHNSVIDIDSDDVLKFRGTVKEIGRMHDLIREYTHAEIIRAATMMEGAVEVSYDDDGVGVCVDTHYEKLAALWGGDSIDLFSPMDALSWPLGSSQHDADAIDGAIASIIDGLPKKGVVWSAAAAGSSPLMYAIREQHGARTIEALCKRGARFAGTEYDAAMRELVLVAHTQIMDAVLDGLGRNGSQFILSSFSVDQASNDMGTALHVCCSIASTDNDLFDKIKILLSHGVDPGRLTKVSKSRAADMLMSRAKGVMVGSDIERELMECARYLTTAEAGPIRREVYRSMKKESGGKSKRARFNGAARHLLPQPRVSPSKLRRWRDGSRLR